DKSLQFCAERVAKSRDKYEAQLFVGWVSGSVTHRGVGFHASTQPTFILYLIPPTYLTNLTTESPKSAEAFTLYIFAK
ncbi:MAG: hypothetical protein ACKO7A_04855, partial [Microcystis sp.]